MNPSADLALCQWQEPGGAEAAQRIAAFLGKIGVSVSVAPIDGPMFLAGMAVQDGGIVVNPAAPAWPGDLLHEAGHIAVTEPASRAGLSDVSADPGEEMAAIAWSVAAAHACSVPLDVLFHPQGYKGDSDNLAELFGKGAPFGVPLLVWYGMTSADAFPAMAQWMRQPAP